MDFEKIRVIKSKLIEEIDWNKLKIKDLENRLEILKINKFEHKFWRSVSFSLLPYTIFIFLIQIMCNKGMIPTYLTLYLSVGIPGSIGVITEKCLEKMRNLKDKTKKVFGTSEIENILEYEIKKQIEKDRLLNKNKVLKEIYEELCLKEKLFEIVLDDFDIYSKVPIKSNYEKDIEYSLINKKEVELNNLIIKKTLLSKIDSKFDIFKDVFLSGAFLLFLIHFPVILFGISGISFSSSGFKLFFNFLLTFGIGSLTTLVYKVKKGNNINNVIDKICNDFIDDNLCRELIMNDVVDYEEEIEKLIKEIISFKNELIYDEIKVSDKKLKEISEEDNFSYSYQPNKDVVIIDDLSNQEIKLKPSYCLVRKK